MSRIAQILLVGRNRQHLLPIARRLEEMGYPTVAAASAAAAAAAFEDLRPAAIVIDAAQSEPEEALRAASALRRRRDVPIIGLWRAGGEPAPAGAFDAVLRHPVHAAQAAARVQSAMRLRVMGDEAALRRRTLDSLGIEIPAAEPVSEALAVLFVGDADPAFMGLQKALERRGAQVVGAFTSFTAFDFLHDRNFHSVVLNALKRNQPAFTICAAMRRNSRLFNVPALILQEPSRFDAVDEAFARGASDLLSVAAPEEESADRILALAGERARGLSIRRVFDSIRDRRALDADTGLFSREVCAAHLTAMGEAARRSERPLACIAVRAVGSGREAAEPGPERLRRARTEFGMMLRHLVRPEDFAGRLEDGVFLLAMPGASGAEAEEAAKRISMVAECSGFAQDEETELLRLRLECGIAQREPGEGGVQMLDRAIARLAEASRRPRREEPVPSELS